MNIKPLIVALVIFIASSAQASLPLPLSMAAMGDSITAGALANFTRADAHNPFALPKFLFYFAEYGLEKTFHVFEYPQNSWATGLDAKVLSHAGRLLQLANENNQDFQVLNAAVSGATSVDLPAQLDKMLAWANENHQGAPDYVMIDIGANDACAKTNDEMTSVADYSNNLRQSVEKVLQSNEHSHVMIGGIPNVEHLREVAYNSWLGFPPFMFCHDIWAKLHICTNVLEENDSSKRAEVMKRIEAYMHEIDVIKQDMNSNYGHDRVRFAAEVYAYNFNDNEISIDCFHPNPQGQQALSDITWKENWWYSLNPRTAEISVTAP